ncbi:MAG: AAA family ATPase [Anaerolineae bacterium]|nr:AAA family ATPase [Anaerolineae bacterium]
MIKRVHVQGYKSLRNVEVQLAPLTVVIGPNAAGKSNLLDALGLLGRAVTAKTLKEAFDEHRGMPLEAFYCGDQGLDGLLSQESLQFTIEVDVELGDEVVETVEQRIRQMREGIIEPESESEPPRRRIVERRLRYTLTVQMLIKTGYLRVWDEKLVALNQDGSVRGTRSAFIEKVENRLRLRMEGQARPLEHEVGLDYTLASTPLYPPHYPHITAFKEELSRWRFYYLEPKSMRADSPLKEVEAPGALGSDLAAFYNTLRAQNLPQYQAIGRALHALLPDLDTLDVGRTSEGFLQLRVMEKGTPFSARVISEGTLRILGLLAITAPLSPTTVIGYEEPENGVHPRRLKLIADLLENATYLGKQIIVNTHSPQLPQYLREACLLLCRKEGRETTFRPSPPLFQGQDIAQILDDSGDDAGEATSLMERIVRGDYGG